MTTATLEHIRKSAASINASTNNMENTPYWKTCKRYIKVYLKQNNIKEISVKDFSNMSGFNIYNSKKMLIDINKDVFNK
jgi:hypothetical protein